MFIKNMLLKLSPTVMHHNNFAIYPFLLFYFCYTSFFFVLPLLYILFYYFAVFFFHKIEVANFEYYQLKNKKIKTV